MAYGDKRDFRKIDLYVKKGGIWQYAASTTWSPNCKKAKKRYAAAHPETDIDNVKAHFAKG